MFAYLAGCANIVLSFPGSSDSCPVPRLSVPGCPLLQINTVEFCGADTAYQSPEPVQSLRKGSLFPAHQPWSLADHAIPKEKEFCTIGGFK